MIQPFEDVTPQIASDVFVADNARIIGDVEIGEQSNIWYGCTLRGDVHEIKVGKRTNIQDGTVVHVSYKLAGSYIGDDVTIGHGCIIHACTIGDLAFIGMGTLIMDEAVVEPQAMLAAGSMLTPKKRVPSGELWAGRPAKFMRKLTDEDIAHFKWSSKHYVNLSNHYKGK